MILSLVRIGVDKSNVYQASFLTLEPDVSPRALASVRYRQEVLMRVDAIRYEGLSARRAAEKYGVNINTVYAWLHLADQLDTGSQETAAPQPDPLEVRETLTGETAAAEAR